MVIGRGDIGKVIEDREGFIFYCNGISNRYPITEELKEKEEDEILTHARTLKMFVYISTLSIYYAANKYTEHKKRMEHLIETNFRNFCIFRIGNITWGTNPNTLINHLKKDSTFVADTYRYLLDKEELNHWIGLIPQGGKEYMNVTGKRLKVKEIVESIKQGKL